MGTRSGDSAPPRGICGTTCVSAALASRGGTHEQPDVAGLGVIHASTSEAPGLLVLDQLTKWFGSLAAVESVRMDVAEGACHALIGPNGAGKSTLFNMVSGRIKPTAGRVLFSGRDITRFSEAERNRVGIATTFQHSTLFDGLSVRANLELAVQRRLGLGARAWPRRRDRARITEAIDEHVVHSGLTDLMSTGAGELSHGQRRRLEIALALATEPRLLLLDEPAAGMSPGECEELIALLRGLQGQTVVLIEHNIDLVMNVASRISVLDAGRLLIEGAPAEVSGSTAVQEAYLGGAP